MQLLTIREIQRRESPKMPATVEFEQQLTIVPEFEALDAQQRMPEEEDTMAMAAVYQQIADRRAQVENAEILRRARAL
jgi:hypothetical protein